MGGGGGEGRGGGEGGSEGGCGSGFFFASAASAVVGRRRSDERGGGASSASWATEISRRAAAGEEREGERRRRRTTTAVAVAPADARAVFLLISLERGFPCSPISFLGSFCCCVQFFYCVFRWRKAEGEGRENVRRKERNTRSRLRKKRASPLVVVAVIVALIISPFLLSKRSRFDHSNRSLIPPMSRSRSTASRARGSVRIRRGREAEN